MHLNSLSSKHLSSSKWWKQACRGHLSKQLVEWIHVPIYFLLGSLRMIPPSFIAVLKVWTYKTINNNLKYAVITPTCIIGRSCEYSQHRSGTSRESPCTPSWWCQPAGIESPAPPPQLDTLPRSLWKPVPSSLPTLWWNRSAREQESWWKTPPPWRGSGCGRTSTWGEDWWNDRN